MGWCTTFDPERFAAAAGGYLRWRAAENTTLLSAAQAARSRWHAQGSGGQSGGGPGSQPGGGPGGGPLLGWWEPPDGGAPRGAFLHDPAVPLLISGQVPEMAASLAATLARMGRSVCGVDAPIDAADAFAAAWSQRAGSAVRMHRQCRVYRLALPDAAGPGAAPGAGPGMAPGAGPREARGLPGAGAWPPPGVPGPFGALRVAAADDRPLLTEWLTAFAHETGERIGSPADLAADLIGYGGAVFWEIPRQPGRRRDGAHYVPPWEQVRQPAALAVLTRPVAGTVRIGIVYTPQERRRSGYAAAVMTAVSRAALTGAAPGLLAVPGPVPGAAPGSGRAHVSEVVMIADGNRPNRWAARLGFQLVGERTVFRFGPPTGPTPRLQRTGPMPRLPTGPLPRLPRR